NGQRSRALSEAIREPEPTHRSGAITGVDRRAPKRSNQRSRSAGPKEGAQRSPNPKRSPAKRSSNPKRSPAKRSPNPKRPTAKPQQRPLGATTCRQAPKAAAAERPPSTTPGRGGKK